MGCPILFRKDINILFAPTITNLSKYSELLLDIHYFKGASSSKKILLLHI